MFKVWATLLSTMLFLSGCATGGSYCDIARAIRPSVSDQISAETKRQILSENQKLADLCDVKP